MNVYQKRYQEDKRKQIVLWKEMVNHVIGGFPHESVKITKLSRIIEAFNTIGNSKALNHTFMLSGGGLD